MIPEYGCPCPPRRSSITHRNTIEIPVAVVTTTPAWLSRGRISPEMMGDLPEAVAELCRRELSVIRLGVDAAVHGDAQAALQCLLLDPVITDLDTARQVLQAYLEAYRAVLPQFQG